jgi:hypothetical protein
MKSASYRRVATLALMSLALFYGAPALHSPSARGFVTLSSVRRAMLPISLPCGLASITFFLQTCTDPEPPCDLRSGPDNQPGPCSPIILDLSGNGFFLTNAANGVFFDISGSGRPVQIGWTEPGADNAFLALPGSDGLIHNGKELFGNFTPQPSSSDPNGFRALAVYDLPENGGNVDGVIDARDAIFSSLRLWVDANHDGICQPEELHTLPSMGVYSISLDYWLSWKHDQYGNRFRYRSEVNPPSDSDNPPDAIERVTYDVLLI